MGERMLLSTEETFRRGGRPEKWAKLSDATIEARRRAGKWPGRTLIADAILKNSITYDADAHGVAVGTNEIYARIHQMGGQAGRKTAPVTIPARPFLVVQDSDISYLERALREFLSGD